MHDLSKSFTIVVFHAIFVGRWNENCPAGNFVCSMFVYANFTKLLCAALAWWHKKDICVK